MKQEHEMWELHILQEIYIADRGRRKRNKENFEQGSEMNMNCHASQKPLIDPDEKNNDKDKI